MGLFEKEIEELRILNRENRQGRITGKKIHERIAIYSETFKRGKTILQAKKDKAKFGEDFHNELVKTNLINKDSVINTVEEDAALDKIKCLHDGKLILRKDCLEISSYTPYAECICDNGAETREMLNDRLKNFPEHK